MQVPGPNGAVETSSPWTTVHGDDGQRQRVRRRILGHVAIAMLALVAAVVALAASPIVVGYLEGERPHAARRGIARHSYARGWAVGPPPADEASTYAPKPSDYPYGAFGGDEPGAKPPAMALIEELLRDAEDQPDDSLEQLGVKANGDLVLRDRADAQGEEAFRVQAGQVMLVVKHMGEWILVAVIRADRTKLGWTTRDRVSLIK